MPNMTIKLKGGAQLATYFDSLPEKMMEKVLRRSLYAGIRVVQTHARALVPILDIEAGGGPHYPGQLLEGIRITTGRRGDEMKARCGITTEVYYGHFVEFGTSHAPAYPFMRPAADAAAGEAAQQIVDTGTANAEKELGKAAAGQ